MRILLSPISRDIHFKMLRLVIGPSCTDFRVGSLNMAEINVETFRGVVQLSGFVNSQADINKAVEVARGVKGVTDVKNAMQLK